MFATGVRAQSNLVLLVSQPGDYIGVGQTYVTTDPGSFSTQFYFGVLEVFASGFSMNFEGPNDDPLVVGSYTNAARAYFNGDSPGLDVYGNGRGCNTVCGSFEIKELGIDGDGNLTHLWLTFTQRCECFNAPMTGEIRYNSELAPAFPPPTALRVPQDYSTIQAAINAANVLVGDTVVVSNGTYYENLDFENKAITVTSLNGPQVTVIDGGHAGPVVSFGYGTGTNSVIKGFTIQNGYNDWGGGITLWWASPTIIGNIFKNNDQGAGGFGAAIGGNGSSPVIVNNFFQDNTADDQWLSGVVSFVNDSSPLIADNIFVSNPCRAINMTIPEGNTPVVINNTIVGNSVGIRVDGRIDTSAQTYQNNILFGNDVGLQVDFYYYGEGFAMWGDNLVFGASDYSGIPDLTGIAGNISANPLFACQPGDDFHLLPGSPCIDAGTNGSPLLPAYDPDGNPRILAGNSTNPPVLDMGAFEFNPASLPVPCMFINCSTDMVVCTAAGQSSAVVDYPTPDATPLATVICVPPSGSAFPGGTNIVTCTATYGTNTVSCSFNVIVVVAPSIIHQPQNVTVSAGQSFTLSVSAGGTPPINYQWLFQGNVIAGANASTLVVSNAQSNSDGVYSVQVYNAAGFTNSSLARVRVLPTKPTIISQPVPLSLFAGGDAFFSVDASGSQPFGYQWFFNHRAIPGANAAQLFLYNVQAVNAGNYSVVVSNLSGSATSKDARLTVNPAAPRWMVQPAVLAVLYGSNVTLTSQAVGSQPIRYQWYFQGRPLRNQTNPQLQLGPVTSAMAGQYYVTAANRYGVITSRRGQLTVEVPPQITRPLTSQIVQAGQNVSLALSAFGDEPMTYSWQFDGQPIDATTASLIITNIGVDQSGYFQVTAGNAYGSTSSVARVSVVYPPSRLVAWGDDSVGQTNIPAGLTKIIGVAGGDFHTIAIRTDGTLAAWGLNAAGQTKIPPHLPPVAFVAAGASHNLALGVNGTIFAWGDNTSGQCNIPAAATNQPLTVSAGDAHSLTLLANGTVVAWGDNTYGQTSLPYVLIPGYYYWWWWPYGYWWPNPYWQPAQVVAAGRNHNLAVLSNGSVVAWGDNSSGQCDLPTDLTNVVDVTGGYLHSVALRADGTVTAWGDDSYGQTDVPPGLTNVVAIAAGDFHTIALLASGRVVGWGDDLYGQTNVPASVTNAVGIASGYYHGLALIPLIKPGK